MRIATSNDRTGGIRRRQRRCSQPIRNMKLLVLAFYCCAWVLVFASGSASARSLGGTRSTLTSTLSSPVGLASASVPTAAFVRRETALASVSFSTSENVSRTATAGARATTTAALLHGLRGGSSRGGGGRGSFSYRPTPPKSVNSLGKSSDESGFAWNKNRNRQDQYEEEGDEDEEQDVREAIDSFLTRDSRNSFIARVYGVLSVQLVFTAITCLLFGTFAPLTNIFVRNSITGKASPLLFLPLAGVMLSTVAWFRVAMSPEARQKSPNKWWWLAIFTVGESLSIGAISSLYKLRSVILAMGATALAAGTVSLYTISQKNSKYDLSQWGATLSSWATILLVYLLLGVAQKAGWLPYGFLPFSDMLYSVFATCLFSVFLAYHTKLIVGGKHAKYRMNEKDYVYGAMALYVDIVNIFLNLLQLLGDQREK